MLPNVGTFTVVDGEHVSRSDLENNFFVTEAQLGQWRAEAVRDNLLELNETVRGHFVARSPEELIAKDLGFFAQFTLGASPRSLPRPPLRSREPARAQWLPRSSTRARCCSSPSSSTRAASLSSRRALTGSSVGDGGCGRGVSALSHCSIARALTR